VPVLAVPGPWTTVLERESRRELEAALLDMLPSRRWFRKTRSLSGLRIVEIVPLGTGNGRFSLAVIVICRTPYSTLRNKFRQFGPWGA